MIFLGSSHKELNEWLLKCEINPDEFDNEGIKTSIDLWHEYERKEISIEFLYPGRILRRAESVKTTVIIGTGPLRSRQVILETGRLYSPGAPGGKYEDGFESHEKKNHTSSETVQPDEDEDTIATVLRALKEEFGLVVDASLVYIRQRLTELLPARPSRVYAFTDSEEHRHYAVVFFPAWPRELMQSRVVSEEYSRGRVIVDTDVFMAVEYFRFRVQRLMASLHLRAAA